ncbi:MAG TPA: RsmD family RNA methyltransferase [Actinomycetota bacterium]|nr:RsmD family RNA methyltransferase [Actinomycetota bacterium]
MRIVAGSAKGVRLASVPPGVRPVSDMAREGLFSSLGAAVHGARVLDLYAGTGAMAIEALSRGAEHAVLIERNRLALRTIRENLERTRLAEGAEVIGGEVTRMLMGDDKFGAAFDVVLADPPYDVPAQEIATVLAQLAVRWLAPAGWSVALTRPKGAPEPDLPVHWHAARRLSYGDTLVLIFQEA